MLFDLQQNAKMVAHALLCSIVLCQQGMPACESLILVCTSLRSS